jgi:hypothetical protein
MTAPKEVSFDRYLDMVFASSSWLDACVTMLAAFLENIDSCRDHPELSLPEIAPSIVDQVRAVAGRAQRLEHQLRTTAERHGPAFQTDELGAVLWWAGMASHKATAAMESAHDKMARNAWENAFFEIHAMMYDTMSALSLLSVAEGMIQHMETEHTGGVRPKMPSDG